MLYCDCKINKKSFQKINVQAKSPRWYAVKVSKLLSFCLLYLSYDQHQAKIQILLSQNDKHEKVCFLTIIVRCQTQSVGSLSQGKKRKAFTKLIPVVPLGDVGESFKSNTMSEAIHILSEVSLIQPHSFSGDEKIDCIVTLSSNFTLFPPSNGKSFLEILLSVR